MEFETEAIEVLFLSSSIPTFQYSKAPSSFIPVAGL